MMVKHEPQMANASTTGGDHWGIVLIGQTGSGSTVIGSPHSHHDLLFSCKCVRLESSLAHSHRIPLQGAS
uniref:Uncharacterized protein n=1 Tax=Arundo donax TaxID=35708 RepID=A0A0A9AX19_ARUDO